MLGCMDRDVDTAIETAAERTREAQERLIEKERRTIAVAPEAIVVERRAEDLRDLAVAGADVELAGGASPGEEGVLEGLGET